MQKEIDQFLRFLVEEKNCSDNTISAYRTDLAQFLDFLKRSSPSKKVTIRSWTSVTAESMKAYLQYLAENKYASSTVARKVAAVKSYFHYLVHTSILVDDPTSELNAPRVEKNPPHLIGLQDITRLLSVPTEDNTPYSQRDKALLEVLYSTGLRVTELISLDVDSYDPHKQTLTCGIRDIRTVPLYSDTTVHLEKYVKDGRAKLVNSSKEKALFLNHRGQRLTRQGLWLIIKRYAKQIGIGDAVTPHTLRHSFAAHLIDSGAELEEVQHRLGHANISTTQTYSQAISDLSEVVVDGKRVG